MTYEQRKRLLETGQVVYSDDTVNVLRCGCRLTRLEHPYYDIECPTHFKLLAYTAMTLSNILEEFDILFPEFHQDLGLGGDECFPGIELNPNVKNFISTHFTEFAEGLRIAELPEDSIDGRRNRNTRYYNNAVKELDQKINEALK